MGEFLTKESPFSPGKPVPIEYFVARIKEIERLERAIKQASSGKNENIFITGERGIGKSSLASFVRSLAEKEYNFIGCHCFLGGVRNLEGMVRVIFQRLLQQVTDKNLFDKLKDVFDKYIKGITLFGVGVEFTRDETELRVLLDNFLPTIRKIHEATKDSKSGLILVLDDLNGITDIAEFSQFLKSFVDELATSNNPLPLLIVLVGISERREDLVKKQPSVARIFDLVDLTPMNKEESNQFFKNIFRRQNISVTAEALSLMERLSGGFPMLMHEVGDTVFWKNTDDKIDENDARDGILGVAENVGKKYLDPQVYHAIGSETYRNILRKIGQLPLGAKFQRKEILAKMTEVERKTFDNFLQRIKKLGTINETEVRGEYKFVNQLYHLYVMLEAFKFEKGKKD